MQSSTNNQRSFAQIASAEIERSSFDRSCGTKTTLNAGDLVPVFVDDLLPGDTVNLTMHTFGRFATMLQPILDNVFLDSHIFAVPMRLLWAHWPEFMGEEVDPGDRLTTEYVIPTMTSDVTTGHAIGSLADYFGIPTGIPSLVHSSMYHRAYNLIWNEWFRDENLQDSANQPFNYDGPDVYGNFPIRKRGKRHDYFTSCLPWPQKGAAVTLPLGTTAPINITTGNIRFDVDGEDMGGLGMDGVTRSNIEFENNGAAQIGWNEMSLNEIGLEADLSAATAATINQIREAFQMQRLMERDARGGTRLVELIKSHFGVTSPDARMQRPEYLGGGTQKIQTTAVPQTSAAEAGSDQAVLAAFAQTSGSNHRANYSATEHCILMVLVSVRADLNYQQGLPRQFSRSTKWDFFWPALAHLGEQAVLNKEIYAQGSGDPTADAATWGYQERWAEYKYKPSMCTGLMRSTASGSVDIWHLAQDFSTLPVLDDAFIQEAPPVDRILGVQSKLGPNLILDCYFQFTHVRPMPTYGTPGLIDHF